MTDTRADAIAALAEALHVASHGQHGSPGADATDLSGWTRPHAYQKCPHRAHWDAKTERTLDAILADPRYRAALLAVLLDPETLAVALHAVKLDCGIGCAELLNDTLSDAFHVSSAELSRQGHEIDARVLIARLTEVQS